MTQRWTTMRQLNNDLPFGCRAEKDQLMAHDPVKINVYDSNGTLVIQESTGHTSVKEVLATLERNHAHTLNLKSNG